MNVGELRKLLEQLPDDADINPDWSSPPGDDDPAVTLEGFAIRGISGGRYLSVLVGLQYLDDVDEDNDD